MDASSLPLKVGRLGARTSVALVKETTMYASSSSAAARRMVHTAVGLPGSSDTAISATARPWRSTRSDAVSSFSRLATCAAATAARSPSRPGAFVLAVLSLT